MVKFIKNGTVTGWYWVEVHEGSAKIIFGRVIKDSDSGKWTNSKDEEQYPTRKAAVEAMMPYASAELAAVRHFANATSEDSDRAHYLGETYRTSHKALMRAIVATYPDMDPQAVYEGWLDSGESIAYVVDYIRHEIEDLHEYALELNAERDAERALEAPQERIAAFLVVNYTDNPNTRVVMGVISPDLPADKATGHTKAGVPFSVVTMDYTNPGVAWRMVDVVANELRNHVKPFKVVIEGIRPDVTYAGTVYTSAHAARVDEPTYRAAGFPSLDAAIGASYAVR